MANLNSGFAGRAEPSNESEGRMAARQTSFDLELAELQMLLEMKDQEGLNLDEAARSALSSSGNDYLFDFPHQRFPKPAKAVVAARVRAGTESAICYIYEDAIAGRFRIVKGSEIDPAYTTLAESYADVAGALRSILTH